MLPRFHLSDIATVCHYLGTLICLAGVLMLVPLACALIFSEFSCALDFFVGSALCLAIGSALRLCKAHILDRRCSLLLTGLAWIVIALAVCIPMFLSGSYASFLDAFFDGVSCVTTTGVSMANNLDKLPYSHIVWHALCTLAGAQAIIIVSLYVGFMGEGGYAAFATTYAYNDLRSSDFVRSRHILWQISALFVSGATIVATCIGLAKGLGLSQSIVEGFSLAANGWSTSAFVPHSANLIFYHSNYIYALALLLMCFGALNFGVLISVAKGHFKVLHNNIELRVFFCWAVLLVILFGISSAQEGSYTSFGSILVRGLFTVVSSFTTTGMQTVYPEQLTISFSDGMLIMFIVAAFLGACSSSGASGVKFHRVAQVLRWFWYSILAALLPKSARYEIRYTYFGVKRLKPSDAVQAMTIVFLYLAVAAGGSMAFIAHGYDALPSVLESVSYVSNTGITTDISSVSMAADLKIIVILQMWLGRLEFIAVFAALASVLVSLSPDPHGKSGRSYRARARKAKRCLSLPKLKFFSRVFFKRKHFMAILALLMVVSTAFYTSYTLKALGSQGGDTAYAATASTQNSATSKYHSINIEDLLSASSRLDESKVKFSGELIGSPLYADETHSWINLSSSGKTIGVLVTNKQAKKLSVYGSYNATGDIVSIEGSYHQSCSQHQGELDVHANALKLVSQGATITHAINVSYFWAGVIFFAVATLCTLIKRLKYGKSKWRKAFIQHI